MSNEKFTEEQLAETFGELESHAWKTLEGKYLKVWFRVEEKNKFSQDRYNWMNFLYATTVKEITKEEYERELIDNV